ncbi:MAG: class I SAM-dependent rRNA methyltransferase [Nannocystaceae bacterium]|nr:class I SAM-dependent rRNA methyltransferase [Nannocystaceae bacterium]
MRRDAGRAGPATGPWIRARQIAKVTGPISPGNIAELVDQRDRPLGWGLYSEASSIALRMISWSTAPPEEHWLQTQITRAAAAREAYRLEANGTTGYRVINSEGDGLPGLVADRYGEDLVVQITTAPMLARREAIVAALREQVSPRRIHVIVPEAAAKHEAIEASVSLQDAPEQLTFHEGGMRFVVDPPPSQKTGAYFDQRDNRRWVAGLAAGTGGTLLDVGCHVGGFALAARAAGVAAIGLDSSQRSLARARANATDAGFSDVEFIEADMFGRLDHASLAGPFGTVVLDPPKLAMRRSDVDRARGAMSRTIGRLAPRVRVGGHIVACSCSHHFGLEALDRAVFEAARDTAWTRVRVLGPDVDHPTVPGHREGNYLVLAVYQRRA